MNRSVEGFKNVGRAVMSLGTWFRTFFLRRRALKHYYKVRHLQNTYSCGDALIDEITGGKLGHHKNMFNILLDRISIIDPNTPDERL